MLLLKFLHLDSNWEIIIPKQLITAISIWQVQSQIITLSTIITVHLDDTFSWNVHVESLYFLRRLRAYGVDKSSMFLFYQAVLESLVRYEMAHGHEGDGKKLTIRPCSTFLNKLSLG